MILDYRVITPQRFPKPKIAYKGIHLNMEFLRSQPVVPQRLSKSFINLNFLFGGLPMISFSSIFENPFTLILFLMVVGIMTLTIALYVLDEIDFRR